VIVARIAAVTYSLPGAVLSNDMLAAEHPEWRMDLVESRTGVKTRYIAGPGESAFSLACVAVDQLRGEHPEAAFDAILFCTQTPDLVMPPNSTLLHAYLGLGPDVFALDFNLACSGYVYGLALAQSLLAGGMATSVLLVTADTYSRLIDPDDRGPRVLFGDGAAATWITAGDRGLVDVVCATSGKEGDAFMVPAGSQTLHMEGARVLGFITSHVPQQIRDLLKRNNLTVDDIDLFIFHQASRLALDALERTLKIPVERSYSNMERVGNTVSASIPMALRDALDGGRARPGDRLLLCGFGVGMSWATAIVDL
jgi:3-oxoacyl-[acyl-carrier-protein] synthase-3